MKYTCCISAPPMGPCSARRELRAHAACPGFTRENRDFCRMPPEGAKAATTGRFFSILVACLFFSNRKKYWFIRNITPHDSKQPKISLLQINQLFLHTFFVSGPLKIEINRNISECTNTLIKIQNNIKVFIKLNLKSY